MLTLPEVASPADCRGPPVTRTAVAARGIGVPEVLRLDVGEVEVGHDHVGLKGVTHLNLLHENPSIALIHILDNKAVRATAAIDLGFREASRGSALRQPYDGPGTAAGRAQIGAVAAADELKIARRNRQCRHNV